MLYSYKTIEGIEDVSSGRVYCELRVMIVAVKPNANPLECIRKLAAECFSPVNAMEVEVFDNIVNSENFDSQSTLKTDSYVYKGKVLKTTIHDIRKISDTVFNTQNLTDLYEYPEELQSFAFLVEDKETYAKFDEGTPGTQAIPAELFEDSNRYFVTVL